jgi:hypothetical protein
MTETVTIKAVGDIFLANLYVNIAYGVGSRLSRNNTRFVESASTFLKDADICTGNLESPLCYSEKKFWIEIVLQVQNLLLVSLRI